MIQRLGVITGRGIAQLVVKTAIGETVRSLTRDGYDRFKLHRQLKRET